MLSFVTFSAEQFILTQGTTADFRSSPEVRLNKVVIGGRSFSVVSRPAFFVQQSPQVHTVEEVGERIQKLHPS